MPFGDGDNREEPKMTVKKSEKWNPLKARNYASQYLGRGPRHLPKFAADGWVRKVSDFAPMTEDEKRAEIALQAEKLIRLQAENDALPEIEEFV